MDADNEAGGFVPIRVNKAMSRAGWCSRREADAWVLAGEVRLNGQTLRSPGLLLRVGDELEARGRRLRPGLEPAGELLYVLLHKPARVLSTLRDPQGRVTARDILPEAYAGARLFPVGRLDYFSEGLLLMTNDGELARRLMHPSFHVPKDYLLWLRERASPEGLARMRGGMTLAEGEKLAPVEVERLSPAQAAGAASLAGIGGRPCARAGDCLRLTLRQGVNRQIRRMCRDLGLTVLRLLRAGQGPLRLEGLPPGKCRALSPEEVLALKEAAGMEQAGPKQNGLP